MSIKVTCSGCNATLNAPDNAAGKRLKCPKCQTICTIPEPELLSASQVHAEPPPLPSDDDLPRAAEQEDDDRPRRRQRGPRRDAHENEPSTAVQMGLGGTATGLGVVALLFSFIPCCGMPFALGFGGLGLLCGGIGVIVALASQKRGLTFPAVGTGISILAMMITVGVYIVAMAMAKPALDQAGKQIDQASKQFEKDIKRITDEAKKQQEEAMKNQKDTGSLPGPLERTETQRKLTQIGIAFLAYKDGKHFPMSSANGQGKLSWRVEILPYIEQQNLYRQFKLDEAWDSPHNLNVLNSHSMPPIFEAARTKPGDDEKKTYYRLFTGPGTCYPTPNAKPNPASISAGTMNTWLLAESKTPVEWTRPDELEVKNGQVPPLGGVYGVGFYVMCADGKPHYVSRDQFSPQALLQLVDPNRAGIVQGWPPD